MEVVEGYNTKTREEYDRMLNELDKKGYRWAWGSSLSHLRLFGHREQTCLVLYDNKRVAEKNVKLFRLHYPKMIIKSSILYPKALIKSSTLFREDIVAKEHNGIAIKLDEPKLYYIKFMEDDEESYLNKHREAGHVSLGLNLEDDIFQTRFTEDEINELGLKYWPFAIEVK